MSEITQTKPVLVEQYILMLREQQVMLDSDLAEIYGVETKVLNQAVKRNIERFPESFRFQLNENELENLRSQAVTSSSRSQIATSSLHGGRRNLPYVFTEQGVAMLSAVLRSDIAIKTSISIMNAFVQMRKTIGNHQQLLQLSQDFTKHKLETTEKFEQVFQALEKSDKIQAQGIFFDGQTYDAYDFVNKLIKKAKSSIIVIDNYIDDSVITQLTKKKKSVEVILLAKSFSKQLKLDIEKANTQYPTFKAINFTKAHDRFLILDKEEIYHIGASLKDLGKKWFAFSKLEKDSVTILESIKGLI
jgi:hypothetical protein